MSITNLWTAASMRDDIENFRVTKLPRSGPKPGQSTESWLKHRKLSDDRFDAKLRSKRKSTIQDSKP